MAPTLVNRAQKLLAHIAQLKEEVAALKELYAVLLPERFMVTDGTFQTWLGMYDFHVVVEGIESAAKKVNRVEQEIEDAKLEGTKLPTAKTKQDMIHYASAAMRDIKKANA